MRLLDVKGSSDEVSNGDGNAKGGFCDVETASDGPSKLIVGAAGFNTGAVVIETSDGSTRLIVGTWRLTGDAAEFGISTGWLKKCRAASSAACALAISFSFRLLVLV